MGLESGLTTRLPAGLLQPFRSPQRYQRDQNAGKQQQASCLESQRTPCTTGAHTHTHTHTVVARAPENSDSVEVSGQDPHVP